jgi:hypothetical protein
MTFEEYFRLLTPLDEVRQALLAPLVAEAWVTTDAEEPGAGVLILADRGMLRRVAFSQMRPRAARALRDALRAMVRISIGK